VKNKDKGEEDGLDDYIKQMESIVDKNIKIYKDLASDIQNVKTLMREEEEAHREVVDN